MLEPGNIIAGKYQVKAVLGRGGMGIVYQVRHALTGRRFALKVLAPALIGQTAAAQRLVREALAVGRIEHRNVVDIFDVGEHEGTVYLVMEYLDGKPLSELLDTGELSDRRLLEILLKAMDGVAAAHEQGVLHRDLKPENIFVCAGASGALDEPRVMDFGICRLPEQLGLQEITSGGLVVGTPQFMCLEQLEGRRDLDARVDVYALGVSLYRGFAGVVPFDGEHLPMLTHRIVNEAPLPLAALRQDLPSGLCEVVMKAIARRREDRYSSVRELADALVPFVEKLSDAPMPARNRTSNPDDATPVRVHPLASATPSWPSVPPVYALPSQPPQSRLQRTAPWLVLMASVVVAALIIGLLARKRSASLPVATPVAAPAPEPAKVGALESEKPASPLPPPDSAKDTSPSARPPAVGARAEPAGSLPVRRGAARKITRIEPRLSAPASAPLAPIVPVARPSAAPLGEAIPGADLIRELNERPAPGRKLDETDPYAN